MKIRIALPLLACLCGVVGSYGQGTLQITFEGPPVQPPDSAYSITNYSESGMLFLGTLLTNGPLPTFSHFVRNGGGIPYFPDDGSAYLQRGPSTLMFSFTNDFVFGLLSVDLAEWSTDYSNKPATIPFIGFEQDGSTVTNVFTTDGIIDGTGPLADFQTFYFTNFTDLTRVEISGPTVPSDPLLSVGWAMDNLVVNIPEPTVGGLLLLGALTLGSLKLRGKFTG